MCAAQRAVNQFQKYAPVLATFKSMILVTLTAATCIGAELKGAIRLRRGILRMMIQHQKKQYQRGTSAYRFRGLIKNETTIRPDDKYHPHIHLLLEGTLADGERIIQDWLKRCTEAGLKVSRSAQDVQVCKSAEEGLAELCKYVVKDATGKDDKITNHPADRQTVVWEAMEGTRALQPVGIKGVPEVDDNCEEPNGTEVAEDTPRGYYRWNSKAKDWLTCTGTSLMSYQSYIHPKRLQYIHPTRVGQFVMPCVHVHPLPSLAHLLPTKRVLNDETNQDLQTGYPVNRTRSSDCSRERKGCQCINERLD